MSMSLKHNAEKACAESDQISSRCFMAACYDNRCPWRHMPYFAIFTILNFWFQKRTNSLVAYTELLASMVYLLIQLYLQNFLGRSQLKPTLQLFWLPGHFTISIFLSHVSLHVTVKGEAGLIWSWWLCGQSRTAGLHVLWKHLQLACQSYADLRKSHPEHPGSPTVKMISLHSWRSYVFYSK